MRATLQYWYLPVMLFLIINSVYSNLIYRINHPFYLPFVDLPQMAISTHSQASVFKMFGAHFRDDRTRQDEYFNQYNSYFMNTGASNIVSISKGDSTFTVFDPRFSQLRYLLTQEENPRYHRFRIGQLSDREFHQLMKYLGSPKLRFDFHSANYQQAKQTYAKLMTMTRLPAIDLQLYHISDPDSNLTVHYRPNPLFAQLELGGIPAKDFQPGSYLIMMASTSPALIETMLITLLLAAIVLWRAIRIKKRLGWIEFIILLIFFYPNNLIAPSLFWSSFFSGFQGMLLMWMLIGLVWSNPRPLSSRKFWKYLFITVALLIYLLKAYLAMTVLVGYALVVLVFLIQLFHQKGLQKKVMGRWFSLGFLPFLLWILCSLVIILGVSLVRKLIPAHFIHGSWLYYQGMVYSLSLDYFVVILFFSLIMLVFMSIPGGLILAMLEYPLRLYYKMRRGLTAIALFGGWLTLVVGFTTFRDRLITHDFFVLFFLFLVGVAFAWLGIKFFWFLDPVHHDERKKLRSLLHESFSYHDMENYFHYYAGFLTRLYSKSAVGLIFRDYRLGLDRFNVPSPELLAQVPEGNYFNLDLARIDRHPAASAFPEWIPPKRRKRKDTSEVQSVAQKEVRLFYPLTDNEGNKLGYLFLAESGKLYWDNENADFIAETVSIFNSFFNNLWLNTRFQEEQVKLEREKQERIMNEQLALEREKRNQELQEFNQRIMDSINYASLIQRSILPKADYLDKMGEPYFVVWHPRDVVGGDYYWFYPLPDKNSFLLAVIDCTGHGVPGAFMTLMSNSILNSIVKDLKVFSPDQIIKLLHREVRFTLQQGHSESMKDGLDISLILVDRDKRELLFSGARHKALLYHEQDGELTARVFSGHRYSLGGLKEELEPELDSIHYQQGDLLYLLTDGLIDQPTLKDAEVKRRPFPEWQEFFQDLAKHEFAVQSVVCEEFLQAVLQLQEQRDDITLLGVKFT